MNSMQNTIDNIRSIRKQIAIEKTKKHNITQVNELIKEEVEEEYHLLKIIENNIGCSIPVEYQSKILEDTISKGGKVLC